MYSSTLFQLQDAFIIIRPSLLSLTGVLSLLQLQDDFIIARLSLSSLLGISTFKYKSSSLVGRLIYMDTS